MKIVVREESTGYAPASERFYAIDDDTYDGAEDSGNRHQVGHGATRIAAIRDLLNILDEDEPSAE